MKDQNEDLGGGSPWYLAPEFMNGRRDPPADVYSLGVVMLYLLRAICLPETQKHWNLEATLQKAPDAVEAMKKWLAHVRRTSDGLQRPVGSEKETRLRRLVVKMLRPKSDRISVSDLVKETCEWRV